MPGSPPLHNFVLFVDFNQGTSPLIGVTAVQTGPASITVNWTPPTPLDGYIISYTNEDDSESGKGKKMREMVVLVLRALSSLEMICGFGRALPDS